VDAPQLTNAPGSAWEAEPLRVSGASAYRQGEFLYQDFLYDDHGARGQRDPADPRFGDDTFSAPSGTYTYPTAERYAENAADLVELRVKPDGDATVFRLTYNTMVEPGLAGTTIALGRPDSPVAAYPFGAGARTRADVFLTVHGAEADLREADGTVLPGAGARVDAGRRQIEVRVPRSAWDPGTSVVRMGAATGLWRDGGYVTPRPGATATETEPGGGSPLPTASAFFNVAFRYEIHGDAVDPFEEPRPDVDGGPTSLTDPRWWRDKAQGDALATGDLTAFAAEVDFGRLGRGATDERAAQEKGVPVDGPINRIMSSRFEPSQGVDFDQECTNPDRCEGQLRGRLQPYAIYVPRKPRPARGFGLTLLLHSLGANHNQFTGSRNQEQFGERGRGHIVITPTGRGPDGWYYDLAGADTFEVWADVAARYDLDPDLTSIAGYSMGGYGTYKFATQFPDLFARAQPTVGPPSLGVSLTGRDSTGGAKTSTFFQLASLRHVPLLMWVGREDQLVPISGTVAQAQEADRLGLRYTFDVFETAEHLTLAVNDQYAPAAEFLGDAAVVRNPAHVTYVVNPTMDFPARRTTADHAYWLSGLRVRNAGGEAPRGAVDVQSLAYGQGDPPVLETATGGGVLTGGTFGALPFTEQSQAWGRDQSTPRFDRLVIRAENVGTVVIDPARARVTCAATYGVVTDGPVTVTLAGCGRTETFGAGTSESNPGRPGPRSGPQGAPRPTPDTRRPTSSRRRCTVTSGFTRVRVVPRGRGLRFDARVRSGSFSASVFRQSQGRLVLGERRVARFTGRRRAFTWSGRGARVGDGVYLVRLTTGRGARADTRRFVVERRGGRFRVRPASARRDGCALLAAFKLERPVFGGRRNRALGISYRTTALARVTVEVLRGGRVLRRFPASTRTPNRTHRLRLASERLPRGDVRIRLRAVPRRGATVTAVLVARRL